MEESAAPKLVAAGMEKVAATTGWAGKATARAEKWNGDVGKRKQKSHQEGTPHLEDRPDYNVKSLAPSPPRSPNPPTAQGRLQRRPPPRTHLLLYKPNGVMRSRLIFYRETRARLGPASVPPLADAWFF